MSPTPAGERPALGYGLDALKDLFDPWARVPAGNNRRGDILRLMTGTELLGVIAATFGVGMGASPLLQAVKAHRRRSSADVSVSFLFVLLMGGLAWLAYGVALGNTPLVVGNSVVFLRRARRSSSPSVGGGAAGAFRPDRTDVRRRGTTAARLAARGCADWPPSASCTPGS